MKSGKTRGGAFAACARCAALCALAFFSGPAILRGAESRSLSVPEAGAPAPTPGFEEPVRLRAGTAVGEALGKTVGGQFSETFGTAGFPPPWVPFATLGTADFDGSSHVHTLFTYRMRIGTLFSLDGEGRLYFDVSPRLSVGVKPDTGKVEIENGKVSFSDILRGFTLSAYLRLR